MSFSEIFFENFGPDMELWCCEDCGVVQSYSVDTEGDNVCPVCELIKIVRPERWARMVAANVAFREQRNLSPAGAPA